MPGKCFIRHEEHDYPLNKTTVFIGVGADNELIFGGNISQRVMKIVQKKDKFYVCPLSDNVVVNKKATNFPENRLLSHNDTIEFNNLLLMFVDEENNSNLLQEKFDYIPKKYQLQRVITEQQNFAIIFAHDINENSELLIKVLTSQGEKDVIVTNEFRRECRLVRQIQLLQHPSLAKIVDVDNGMCPQYYVMENSTGISLNKYLKRRRTIQIPVALNIIYQLAEILNILHQKLGILHRDLNLENVFLSKMLVPKLYNLESIKGESVTTLTVKGDVKGTIFFTAPEVYLEEASYSIQSDIYSLGLIFLCMIKGDLFIQSPDLVFNFDIYQVEVDNVKDILVGMLERSPEKRFATYNDLILALKEKMPAEAKKKMSKNDQENKTTEQLMKEVTGLQKQHEYFLKSVQAAFADLHKKIQTLEEENIKIKQENIRTRDFLHSMYKKSNKKN
ncbi:serine/threonine-protein kinase [Candidatus Uabimicrobium sp. HlEnr_7]|uniref:serine/threonine-protein kinase n=1 Tax=Candidatus Uabimicrobium helgolandensis TaxID=3095367 RepID=UPI0035581661